MSEWVVVGTGNRTEPSRSLRVLQRRGGEEKESTDDEPRIRLEPPEKVSRVKDCDDFRSLVGAPIRKPKRETNAELEVVSSKVGDSFHLVTSSPSIPLPTESSPAATVAPASNFDLSDAGEWPSMGIQEGTVPQLGSWSTVVKKPALPRTLQKLDEVYCAKAD